MTLEDFIELGDYIYKINMRPSENETNVECEREMDLKFFLLKYVLFVVFHVPI